MLERKDGVPAVVLGRERGEIGATIPMFYTPARERSDFRGSIQGAAMMEMAAMEAASASASRV